MQSVQKNSNGDSPLRQLARAAMRSSRIHKGLSSRYLPSTADIRQRVEQSLRQNFFPETCSGDEAARAYLATAEGRDDLEDHVARRLQLFRTWIIPWLDSLFKLDGSNILEIGCGTGASTIALTEQGAAVVGVDISSAALASARDRCAAYGLQAEFVQANAVDIGSRFSGKKFDAILFFAVLEHLTWSERIASLKAAWDLLTPNSILAVIEAPNRLWYWDIHTTDEAFYNWLPDEAAIAYTRYIDGHASRKLFEEPADEAKLTLARLGRGVSYHEFVIAWNIARSQLPVAGYAAQFHERPLVAKTLGQLSAGSRFRKFLSGVAPDLHPAFLQPSLDLAFRKTR